MADRLTPLQSIPAQAVRGMDLIHELLAACDQNEAINTASLLERYRDKNYYNTLAQLAQHQHNNIETLTEEEAAALIEATETKIIEEFNENQLTKAADELARLTKKAAISALPEEDENRRQKLAQLIRNNLK